MLKTITVFLGIYGLLNIRRVYTWLIFFKTKNYYDLYNIRSSDREKEAYLEALLEKHFIYFKPLSKTGRNKLMARIWKVYPFLEFKGYQGVEISEEMKLRVLFSNIQLTYGLKSFRFRRFYQIILYPETFYSHFFERELKGLTSGKGFITLSWEDFEHGYDVHHDKFNLGLHEMAHALRLELDSRNIPGLIDIYNDRIDEHAQDELNLTEREVPSILRDYSNTNDEEFFAVCIEYFFEKPDLLKAHKPNIYKTLCQLLNQDPLNTNGDYSLELEATNDANSANGQRAIEV